MYMRPVWQKKKVLAERKVPPALILQPLQQGHSAWVVCSMVLQAGGQRAESLQSWAVRRGMLSAHRLQVSLCVIAKWKRSHFLKSTQLNHRSPILKTQWLPKVPTSNTITLGLDYNVNLGENGQKFMDPPQMYATCWQTSPTSFQILDSFQCQSLSPKTHLNAI